MIEHIETGPEDVGFNVVRVPRIVLSGGQCAGKTAILKRVEECLGDQVVCVTETATLLRNDLGFKPRPEYRMEIRTFQYALFLAQIAREAIAERKAIVTGARAILLDRGTLDGIAYLPRGLEEFEELNNTTLEIQLKRYDVVVLVAQPTQDVYEQMRAGTSSWPCARSRHETLEDVWGRHESCLRVTDEDIQRINSAVTVICELVRSFPAAVTLHKS